MENNKAKIVKSRDWYDPEGLGMPEHIVEVIMEGTLKECDKYMSDVLLCDLKHEYRRMDDISVHLYQTNTFGGTKLNFNIGYIEVYFYSAISKNYYRIIPAK